MKSFAVLSALVACGLAAPAADADAQIIAGGVLGHGHGLVNGVYASGPAVAAAAPVAVAATAAAPVAVAHAAPVAVVHAAPVAVAHAAPVAVAHAAPTHVAVPTTRVHKTVQTHLVPETRLVGHQVHTQVHHVPQVHVNTHTSTHTTHHVINHPTPVIGASPVIGAYAGIIAGAVSPAAVAPAVVDAAVVEAEAPAVEAE